MRPPKPPLLVSLVYCAALLGACTGTAGQSSPNLPDVPVYPGAELAESVVMAGRDPTEYYLVRDASAAEVQKWYREHMARAGWAPSSDPDDALVFYHDSEGCYGYVGAYDSPDGTVELQLSQQAPGTTCEPYVTTVAGDD